MSSSANSKGETALHSYVESALRGPWGPPWGPGPPKAPGSHPRQGATVSLSVLPFRRRPDCSLNTLQSPRGRHLPSQSSAEVYQGNERSQLREMFHRDDTCKAQFLGRKWLLEAVTAPCLSDHHLDTSGPLLQSWRPGTHRGFLSHLFALHKNVLYCFYLTVGILHEGDPIPKMVLSSGGQAHCSTDFPRWLNVLGIHLDQCTSWHCCERLHSAAVNFFFFLEDSFNACAHFMRGDLRVHLPTPR